MTEGGPVIIDTHTHLDDAAFDADRDQVIAAARHAGVRGFVNIAYAPDRWPASLRLRDRHRDVKVVLGLHPQQADEYDEGLERLILDAAKREGAVAIGETGLDFFRSGPSKRDQLAAFRGQLAIAESLGLPVVIHQRDASDDLLAALESWEGSQQLVLHSFDGSDRLLDFAVARGCLIGVGGLAARPRSESLRRRLRRTPLTQVLLETDAPYLPPPRVGSRRNQPAFLPTLAEMLAPIWSLTAGDLCRVTTVNARRVFGLFDAVASRSDEL